jgi:hypothetical protein
MSSRLHFRNFHISQVTVPRTDEYIAHHRPLGLLLLLTLIAWQSGVFSAFAAILPVSTVDKQHYIYVQSSPLTDDAWIGTRVAAQGTINPIQPTAPLIQGSWIGTFTKAKKNQPLSEIVFSAAPSLPVPDTSPIYPVIPVQYTTPNGTPINNISPTYTPTPVISLVNSVFGRNGTVV